MSHVSSEVLLYSDKISFRSREQDKEWSLPISYQAYVKLRRKQDRTTVCEHDESSHCFHVVEYWDYLYYKASKNSHQGFLRASTVHEDCDEGGGSYPVVSIFRAVNSESTEKQLGNLPLASASFVSPHLKQDFRSRQRKPRLTFESTTKQHERLTSCQ